MWNYIWNAIQFFISLGGFAMRTKFVAFVETRIAQQFFFFTNLRWNPLYFSYLLGKGGLGSTKFVAFETLAWHNECFFCNICKDSMVGKGFIQVVIENLGSPRMSFASCIFVYNLYTYLYTYTHYTARKRCSPFQDGENIICPECARKKMMEEIEAEWGEYSFKNCFLGKILQRWVFNIAHVEELDLSFVYLWWGTTFVC